MQKHRAAISLSRFFKRTIWETHNHPDMPRVQREFYACLRFLAVVWHGITHNRMLGNAAALSYSMLIALGPLIAVVVMISGFVFQNTEEDKINEVLNNAIAFISTPATVSLDPTDPAATTSGNQVNPEVVNVVEHLIDSARSGAVGLAGSLILIVISIQLIITIEKSLNQIWGVKRGRTAAQRVVFYWTFLSLGTILGLAAVALSSASTLTHYASDLPFGETLLHTIRWGAPVLSSLLVIGLLASFYRFMPNTFVQWRAALGGAVIAVLLIIINKEMSFLYVSRMIREQSLYGSIGIIPVFMFGLYMFWIFILIGGQVSYAFQNIGTITSLRAWENISQHTRESLSLAALVDISRRFKNCEPAPSVEALSERLRVPQKILNHCLRSLMAAGIINPIENEDGQQQSIPRYQPARPLEAISLGYFKRSLDMHGNDEGMRVLNTSEPIVDAYRTWLEQLYTGTTEMTRSLNRLIEESPALPDPLEPSRVHKLRVE